MGGGARIQIMQIEMQQCHSKFLSLQSYYNVWNSRPDVVTFNSLSTCRKSMIVDFHEF